MPKKKTNPGTRIARSAGGPELSFGTRIKTLRQDAEFSIRELSRRCGIASTTLQTYEAGGSLPGAVEIRKLGEQFDRSVHFLTTGEEWSGPDGDSNAPFFSDENADLYIAKVGAALRALPAGDRRAVERLLESLLVGAVGRKRLSLIQQNASLWLVMILEAGGEWLPEVPAESVPWAGGSFDPDFDPDSQEIPEKPAD